jgi:hypothetical protein
MLGTSRSKIVNTVYKNYAKTEEYSKVVGNSKGCGQNTVNFSPV